LFLLNIKKLLEDEIFPFVPNNKFKELKYERIKGIMKYTGYSKYYGQIDGKTGKPDGIGVVITLDTQNPILCEGTFKDGNIVPTYVEIGEE